VLGLIGSLESGSNDELLVVGAASRLFISEVFMLMLLLWGSIRLEGELGLLIILLLFIDKSLGELMDMSLELERTISFELLIARSLGLFIPISLGLFSPSSFPLFIPISFPFPLLLVGLLSPWLGFMLGFRIGITPGFMA